MSSGDGPVSSAHLAVQAADREAMRRVHAAALAAGGTDNGGPGEVRCRAGCYAACVLDPDGNNVEAVHRGPERRSAASVAVTPLEG